VDAFIANIALLAADPGRGGNPSEGGGIGIVVGIALGFLVAVALVGLVLRSRIGRRRSDIFRRRKHRPGSIGRVGGRR
jgi:hypothetical protein